MEKLCRRCDTIKPIEQFRKDSAKKSGYGSCCKACSTESAKAWQRRNPEKRKAQDAAWYAANKERKAVRDAQRLPAYRQRRRELDRARWATMTEDERRARWNRWYWANEQHSLRYKQAQRVIRRSTGADWKEFPTSLAYVQIIASDPCVYCGSPTRAIDHIHPVSRGGTGEWTNLAPSCMRCNSSKGNEPLLSFLLRRGETRT